MQLHIYDTATELIENLAIYFTRLANNASVGKKRFSVALSGGNSPKKLYALLASDRFKNQVDWQNIDFFFGDERNVPPSDPASNFRMVNETLFQPLNIPGSQVFRVMTELSPPAAAADYAAILTNYFNRATPRFDLVLLGLGDNAHTASLFPGTPVLHETEATVRPVYLEDQQVYRITFTAPLINLAHHIAFLVYGNDKAAAVSQVLHGKPDFELYPAQLIRPLDGELVWFLDKAAAPAV